MMKIYYDGRFIEEIVWWLPEWHLYQLRKKFSPDRMDINYHLGEVRIYSMPE